MNITEEMRSRLMQRRRELQGNDGDEEKNDSPFSPSDVFDTEEPNSKFEVNSQSGDIPDPPGMTQETDPFLDRLQVPSTYQLETPVVGSRDDTEPETENTGTPEPTGSIPEKLEASEYITGSTTDTPSDPDTDDKELSWMAEIKVALDRMKNTEPEPRSVSGYTSHSWTSDPSNPKPPVKVKTKQSWMYSDPFGFCVHIPKKSTSGGRSAKHGGGYGRDYGGRDWESQPSRRTQSKRGDCQTCSKIWRDFMAM